MVDYYRPEPRFKLGPVPLGRQAGEKIPWDRDEEGEEKEAATIHCDGWDGNFQHHTLTLHQSGKIIWSRLREGYGASRTEITLAAEDANRHPFLKKVIYADMGPTMPGNMPISAAKSAYF